jgi:hypothetical protein
MDEKYGKVSIQSCFFCHVLVSPLKNKYNESNVDLVDWDMDAVVWSQTSNIKLSSFQSTIF